jgi:hypothetical protein
MSNVALRLISWQNHRQVLVPEPLAANLFDWRVVWHSSQARHPSRLPHISVRSPRSLLFAQARLSTVGSRSFASERCKRVRASAWRSRRPGRCRPGLLQVGSGGPLQGYSRHSRTLSCEALASSEEWPLARGVPRTIGLTPTVPYYLSSTSFILSVRPPEDIRTW